MAGKNKKRLIAPGVGLMPALDADSVDALLRVVERTTKIRGIAGYKLGLTAVLRLGLFKAVRRLRDVTDLPIIYDHQKAGPDMPDMADKFVAICREAGVDGLILFPIAGPEAVRKFVGGAIAADLFPVVGGEIPVADYTVAGGGYVANNGLDRIIAHAAAVGARHFVLPANNPATIKARCAKIRAKTVEPVLFLTGFGPMGGEIGPAFAAAAACPTRIAIVGRGVYASPDPAKAARRLIAEMNQFA